MKDKVFMVGGQAFRLVVLKTEVWDHFGTTPHVLFSWVDSMMVTHAGFMPCDLFEELPDWHLPIHQQPSI